jgi:hypothetical protein
MGKRFRINLLVKKERRVLNETITYLNSYAKYVIVLTQIVVLMVFFIKIILDQTVIDLKETIDQKNQIILTAREMIDNNNLLAKKLIEVDKILLVNNFRYTTLRTTLSNIPSSVSINSISMREDQLTLEGVGSNPIDIQKLQNRLNAKLDSKVTVVSITKELGIYIFQLEIKNEQTS